MKSIPVILFAYARPEHLKKTVASLKANNVPRIYAFADGAKTPEKNSAVAEVRQVLKSIDWCDISIVERTENLGLGVSIVQGVTEVFKANDTVIVIEDDVVLRLGAYDFLCRALEFYKKDPRILSASLWSHPQLVPITKNSIFFSPRFNCWGWGAYKRSWEGMEKSALALLAECKQRKINVNRYGNLSIWAQSETKMNTWATRFAVLHYLKQGVCILPTQTWADNVGCDGSGTNCPTTDSFYTPLQKEKDALSFPEFVKIDAPVAKYIRFFEGDLLHRTVIKFIKWIIKKRFF